MLININLSEITANDTIVLANNRQVLALKNTWRQQKGISQLPQIFSWQQYLQNTWRKINLDNHKRLISAPEVRMLVRQSMRECGQKADNRLLDEAIKNLDYCYAHNINIEQLLQAHTQNCTLFIGWIKHYQQHKLEHNLLDINDLSQKIISTKTDIISPIIYGFKTLTPQQLQLFTALNYKTLTAEKLNKDSHNLSFKTTGDEILAAAKWAKDLHAKSPKHSIAIISPQLNQNHHQIKSIFDQVFDDVLIETGQKAYNISLGLPLTQYPLIQHILLILQLCQQLNRNRINTETFNAVITSPYIADGIIERCARAQLVNRVLSLSKTHFKSENISQYLIDTPALKNLITSVNSPTNNRQSYEKWLLDFNIYLQIWGFATDRTLDSSEYQLFNKYQQTSLGLNQLAQIHTKVDAKNAITDLKNWLSPVIFQAQSAKTPIQILGSLEAEGLCFDDSWVLGMTDDFLPAKLNSPRFIPTDIAIEHQIPHSSFDLITKDANTTLGNLINLSNKVVFSYAENHFENQQDPSPFLEFKNAITPPKIPHQNADMENITDAQSIGLKNTQVSGGVGILKDQMLCGFKGFTHRLNIQHFDPPHIGLNRAQQGSILHNILANLFEIFPTRAKLLDYSETELNALIDTQIKHGLSRYSPSGFKKIEHKRLKIIIQKFINTEKQREDFCVIAIEKTVQSNINGLCFNTRLDRMDELENGERIIFDYKTGNIPSNSWCANPIKEPQLPIYAINNNSDGIAFIQPMSEKTTYTGLAKNQDLLPNNTKQQRTCGEWDEQLSIWKTHLEQASTDYQQGKAPVLPTKNACQYCEFDSLCRVKKA